MQIVKIEEKRDSDERSARQMKSSKMNYGKIINIFIFLLLFFVFYAEPISADPINNTDKKVVWLEFKLPPYYDEDRKEIQGIDIARFKEDYKRYEEERKKYEKKYRESYEKMFKSNPEFLRRNPFKYSEYKNPKINYDALALLSIEGADSNDYAFVVADIIKEGKYAGQARINRYKRESGGNWRFISSIDTYNDIGVEMPSGNYIISGCQKSGTFISPRGNGNVIDIKKEATKVKKDAMELRAIIDKELGVRIQAEKDKYKKETNILYLEELRIAGIFEDLNGDGKLDIIATLNDPKYMNIYPDRKIMPTGSRFQLFCRGEEGCEYYLFLNKGDNSWDKVPLGYANCIGISRANGRGISNILMERASVVWDGATYKVIPGKPNWMKSE